MQRTRARETDRERERERESERTSLTGVFGARGALIRRRSDLARVALSG